MCEKYGIDVKTRFLVLYFDAQMRGPDIARIINKPMRTIERWLISTKKGEDIRIHKGGNGRKKSITEETENKIVQVINEDPEGTSLRKLAARFAISRSSIARTLEHKGLRYKSFDRSIIYAEEERMIREDFCKKMLSEDGKLIYRTFFSDEMGIELGKAHKTRAWQFPSKKLRKKNITGNIKLDCWGAISAQGATSLEIYKKGMNGNLFRRIIENHKAEMEELYSDGEFYFIQDNHPAHRMNEDWMINQQNIKLIKLPTKSPDLNIIENLWTALKDRVKSDSPTNERELRESLLNNWKILTRPERLYPCFEGLHKRYEGCVAKDGQKVS